MLDLRTDSRLAEQHVELPDFGTVRLRQLSGLERLEMEQHWQGYEDKGPDLIRRMVLLIVYCACDDNGKALYGLADIEDIARTQTPEDIQTWFTAALKLNHMDVETVEERAGNSEPIRAD